MNMGTSPSPKPIFVFEPPGSKQPVNILEELNESPSLSGMDLQQPQPLIGMSTNQIKLDKKTKKQRKVAKKGVQYILQPSESPP